ncbi:hypothetical protein B0H14DRAFT_3492705 [Mycena olivaceomarginata]|nr:hypothetical protein B0H14DRAFT_3492705 [Mycena olivaceomarginata]
MSRPIPAPSRPYTLTPSPSPSASAISRSSGSPPPSPGVYIPRTPQPICLKSLRAYPVTALLRLSCSPLSIQLSAAPAMRAVPCVLGAEEQN